MRYAVHRNCSRIAELVSTTGLSSRRFIQLFKEQVGLPPKLFARLQRFQRALASAHLNSKTDWAEIALDCGYYDQSHLIRDFNEFAGMSPRIYGACANEHRNHVPILGSSLFGVGCERVTSVGE